jgi:hypothetical protein
VTQCNYTKLIKTCSFPFDAKVEIKHRRPLRKKILIEKVGKASDQRTKVPRVNKSREIRRSRGLLTEGKAHVLGEFDAPIESSEDAVAPRFVRVLRVGADESEARRRDVDVGGAGQEAGTRPGAEERVARQQYVPSAKFKSFRFLLWTFARSESLDLNAQHIGIFCYIPSCAIGIESNR